MSSPPGSRSAGIILALAAAGFYALSLVTARASYDHGMNAQSVMFIRFILLAVLLLLWNQRFQLDAHISMRDRIASIAVGITYFVGIGSYLMSVGYMPVTLAVIIFYTFPILTALAHALLHRRKPGLTKISALLIAFSGLYIALDVEIEGTRGIGILFAATASFSVMLNMIGSSRLLQRIPTTLFAFYQAFSVCLLSALALAFSGGLLLPVDLSGAIYLGVMLLAFLTAYLCSYNAIRLIGPVSTATIMNLEPITTILFAVILLGELLSSNQALGGAIVLGGIVLAQRYAGGYRREGK